MECCRLQVMARRLAGGAAGPGADACLLLEADPERFLELGRTKDGAYVTINSNSKTSSEVLGRIILICIRLWCLIWGLLPGLTFVRFKILMTSRDSGVEHI